MKSRSGIREYLLSEIYHIQSIIKRLDKNKPEISFNMVIWTNQLNR